METFQIKNFNIGNLSNIGTKTTEEHLKLYGAYVKNANIVFQKIKELEQEKEKNTYAINEVRRRLSFEIGGIKNHEIYFDSLSDGAQKPNEESLFFKKVLEDFDSFENFIQQIKECATTRGIGWVMVYFDKEINKLIISWVDEQHIGQLAGLPTILCLDMWEHSYYLDFIPSEKNKYVEAFFENLNWSKIENNFKKV